MFLSIRKKATGNHLKNNTKQFTLLQLSLLLSYITTIITGINNDTRGGCCNNCCDDNNAKSRASTRVCAFNPFTPLTPTAIKSSSINIAKKYYSSSCITSLERRNVQCRPISSSSSSSFTTTTRCSMALIPLDVSTLQQIISVTGKPTGEQYATYYGRTMKERYSRTIESATVGFLGVFFSYFLSFIIGSFLATILGSLFFFWGILSPELKAYQRNWEFLGGRQLIDIETVREKNLNPNDPGGLYGALFIGHINHVCVVEDTTDTSKDEYDLSEFMDYTMENDELDKYYGTPYLLRLQCIDQYDRTLQIHTRLSEVYVQNLQRGMPCSILLLSTTPSFTKLAALSDVFVLTSSFDDDDEEISSCWIGDYPYINHLEFEALIAEDDEIWNELRNEAVESDVIVDDGYNDDDDSKRNDILIPATKNRRRQS